MSGIKTGVATLAMAAALVLPAAARAQQPAPASAEPSSTGGTFVYLDDHLTIHVDTDVPGRIQLLHGRDGLVTVTASSTGGTPAYAMSGQNRLTLTSLGGERAQFVVTVPRDARVTVELPDRTGAEVFGTTAETVRYDWSAPAAPAKSQGR